MMHPDTGKWICGTLIFVAILFILFFLVTIFSGAPDVKPKWLGHEVQAIKMEI